MWRIQVSNCDTSPVIPSGTWLVNGITRGKRRLPNARATSLFGFKLCWLIRVPQFIHATWPDTFSTLPRGAPALLSFFILRPSLLFLHFLPKRFTPARLWPGTIVLSKALPHQNEMEGPKSKVLIRLFVVSILRSSALCTQKFETVSRPRQRFNQL